LVLAITTMGSGSDLTWQRDLRPTAMAEEEEEAEPEEEGEEEEGSMDRTLLKNYYIKK
jgi:hypothetical protein